MKTLILISSILLFSFKESTIVNNLNRKNVNDYFISEERGEIKLMVNLKKPVSKKINLEKIVFKNPSALKDLSITYQLEYTVVICTIKSK
jgi:hypothetical protein